MFRGSAPGFSLWVEGYIFTGDSFKEWFKGMV